MSSAGLTEKGKYLFAADRPLLAVHCRSWLLGGQIRCKWLVRSIANESSSQGKYPDVSRSGEVAPASGVFS
ncbi:Hypothetical protein PSEBR_m1613 [Pseudomonas brassicacearum subsp. brassicacearum NFM421]|uniref:Uncharacterized protein n=1 Tax=Pseudomonas brassicacearum (strain NFM421) TaxID=994484 RepID=F2KM75_PSEBN|nr:Hypothetical protein PSEBR_m1613 [Pseudomonas brassicacearum subsp. brassicacearum NFM421]